MTPQSLRVTLRLYDLLLRAYPPDFRARFAGEMRQVARLLCQERYARHGALGLAALWLSLLWDWSRSAVVQWARHFRLARRTAMNANLDPQLGDLAWSISTGLRAGYRLRDVLGVIVNEAPEPAASACKWLLSALDQGQDLHSTLERWKQTYPSAALARLAGALGQLKPDRPPETLDSLSEDLVREHGSDPAFHEAMRREAAQLGAKIPERACSS